MYYVDRMTSGIFTSYEHFIRAQGDDVDIGRLIEISDEEHEQIASDFQKGYSLLIKGNIVTTVAPPEVAVDEKRARIINIVDAVADEARTRDQSIGQLLDIEYQQVIEAHSRWYADGYDETKCPEEIQAWADAEGVSPLQAAQEIAEAAAHREEVIRQIRSIRLAGKAAVRAAADDADFTTIAEPFVDQLNHIGETTIAAA